MTHEAANDISQFLGKKPKSKMANYLGNIGTKVAACLSDTQKGGEPLRQAHTGLYIAVAGFMDGRLNAPFNLQYTSAAQDNITVASVYVPQYSDPRRDLGYGDLRFRVAIDKESHGFIIGVGRQSVAHIIDISLLHDQHGNPIECDDRYSQHTVVAFHEVAADAIQLLNAGLRTGETIPVE